MQYNLPMPPTLVGSEAEQLVQIHRYLFRMNDMLNQALDSQTVTVQDVITQQQEKNVSVEKLDAELAGQYNRAKALIIKTADDVRAEMDLIETTLKSQYLAISEFGTYREEVSQEIEETAKGVVQSFNYQSQIDALGADFDNYRTQTEGYIQSGIIAEKNGVPIIGIAIGQNLRSRVVDGKVYIDMTQNLATYTSDRITFWQGGVDVAHIANNELVIQDVHVRGKFLLGDGWEISHTDGFAIKWVGGDN